MRRLEESYKRNYLFIPASLDIVTCYIMEDNVDSKALNNLPQKRLKFINIPVSSYYYIIKYL